MRAQILRLINKASKYIHTWKRFIDAGTTDEFKQYIEAINQIHSTIKFTHEVNDSELTFLDVTIPNFKHTRLENVAVTGRKRTLFLSLSDHFFELTLLSLGQ